MKLLLSDRELPAELVKRGDYKYISLVQKKIHNCTGCFGSWVRTPGKCVIRDDATEIYPLIAQSEKLIYVSRIYLGSYDIPMKIMLERAIPVQKAFIRIHGGETHHVQRDVKEKEAVIIGYGNLSEKEKNLFENLVERNAKNMSFKRWRISFVEENEVDEAVIKELDLWEN